MASTTSFFDAIKSRRSYYAIAPESPIPQSRIQEIVNFAITHVPSAWNVQSARAVVLFADEHKKLWTLIGGEMQQIVPAAAWEAKFKGMLDSFKDGGYGTVIFFEDQDKLAKLIESKTGQVPADAIYQFSEHSAGMHHFAVWTALEAEGLGGSLQHMSIFPSVVAEIAKTWNLPASWKPNAQLVFGTPKADPYPREYDSLEERVKVFA